MAVTSILNNIAALGASYELGITGTGMQDTIQQLTTGKRINMASDDASGLVIANGLTASTLIDTQGQDNANNTLAALQTQDGTLNEATNLLTRAAQLAQEAQGYNADTSALDAEYQSIVTTFNSLTSTTATVYTTALGSIGSTTTFTVTVAGITALSGSLLTGGASAAATTVGNVLGALGSARGDIGAGEESLQAYSDVLGIEMQNQTSQLSQIQDANVANAVVNLTKFQILNQSGISALSKANQAGQSILALLQ